MQTLYEKNWQHIRVQIADSKEILGHLKDLPDFSDLVRNAYTPKKIQAETQNFLCDIMRGKILRGDEMFACLSGLSVGATWSRLKKLFGKEPEPVIPLTEANVISIFGNESVESWHKKNL